MGDDMADRDSFLARMADEVSRQNAVIAKKREDEATAEQRITEVIGRLREILSHYSDWLKASGFTVAMTSTGSSLSLDISDPGKEPSRIDFGLGPEGTFTLSLSEPFDIHSGKLSLAEPTQVAASDWSDDLFEGVLQEAISELVERRSASLT
jgi:hypothetical protein